MTSECSVPVTHTETACINKSCNFTSLLSYTSCIIHINHLYIINYKRTSLGRNNNILKDSFIHSYNYSPYIYKCNETSHDRSLVVLKVKLLT